MGDRKRNKIVTTRFAIEESKIDFLMDELRKLAKICGAKFTRAIDEDDEYNNEKRGTVIIRPREVSSEEGALPQKH